MLPFADSLRKGVKHFYDPKLPSLRRYLPNVGKEKNKDEVDSWYLFHPLANLGRLASEGDEEARRLYFEAIEFAIKVARHFNYKMPVLFNVETLEVIRAERQDGMPGQTDAAALYAYVMLQAFEMTKEKRFLNEAKAAIRASDSLGFNLHYQANICAWGANACLHLWRITGEIDYLGCSYVYLANFIHNCIVWESDIKAAEHYPVFFGATCLHDGPYMALYECFEAFAAFHEYLSWGGDDLPESVRLLLTEYCKYTLSRAWFYYPREVPKEILATDVRNGHIDRGCAFPVEDLYADGKPVGRVGQEIYGTGAAFAFVVRSYHRLSIQPIMIYCEYPIYDVSEGDMGASFRVRGVEGWECRGRVMPIGRHKLPPILVTCGDKNAATECTKTREGHLEFVCRGSDHVTIGWH